MIHIHDAQFLTFYDNEPEHAPHMEAFSKFASYLENKNFIFRYCKKFLAERSLRIDTILLSVFDITKSVSGKNNATINVTRPL